MGGFCLVEAMEKAKVADFLWHGYLPTKLHCRISKVHVYSDAKLLVQALNFGIRSLTQMEPILNDILCQSKERSMRNNVHFSYHSRSLMVLPTP